MSRPVVERLAAQIEKLATDPAASDKLKTAALEPLPGYNPDSFAAYIKSETDRWAAIVKRSGAELQ